MVISILKKRFACNLNKFAMFGGRSVFLSLFLLFSSAVQACPELLMYYQGEVTEDASLEQELIKLMPLCLESSEYFALLGSIQLRNGKIPASLEALERALLLEPRNGAAQIDYSEALFLQGDLFAAIELNENLLQREDTPTALLPLLEERQETWQSFTEQRLFQLELLTGYDSNLNTAPNSDQVTLTLSGEPVVLELNPDFQPVSGPYINFGLGGRLRQLRPGYQHDWRLEASGRISEEKKSDLLQLSARYSFIRPSTSSSWQVNGALTNLFFGGRPLYTASEGIARVQVGSVVGCDPYYDLALQHQLFHERSELNALETKLAAGLSCPMTVKGFSHQLVFELGLLNNFNLQSGRPGGDRHGWQANLIWRLGIGGGELISQFNYTTIDDQESYSPILAGGAYRSIARNYVLFQYRRPYSNYAAFIFNVFHQEQRSNIELFRNKGTSIEIGVGFIF